MNIASTRNIRSIVSARVSQGMQQVIAVAIVCLFSASHLRTSQAQTIDREKTIREQTYFDNQDWDWYVENIPFFDCPDPEILTTYYYRWELITKHLTYGNPDT